MILPVPPVQLILALTTAAASLVIYRCYKLAKNVYAELASPLRNLPGPPNRSFFYGNFKELWEGESTTVQEKWVEEYGETYRYSGPFCAIRLFSMDVKFINHVLVNSYDYQRPEAITYGIKRMLGGAGEGLVVAEGERHRHQRHIMNPAFGPRQIRELTEIFVEKAIELRDKWTAEVANQEPLAGFAKLDALSWVSRATLDIIGLAGFHYKFDTLANAAEKNELGNAFAVVFKAGTKLNAVSILRNVFPFLRFLKAPRDAEADKAKETMLKIGRELLEESKANLARDEDKRSSGRDLLSLLVRANTTLGLLPSQRLDDSDVVAQIPAFLVAGHETTSCATTWALFALTQSQAVQTRLREELSTISTDNPTMDELNDLPYLEAVVRESLRLYPPMPGSVRVAMKDDIVPLSKPFVDRHGRRRHELHIKKGTIVSIPITHLNRAKSLWGDDAGEFKPERWEKLPDAVASIPGVWGNMMTFVGGQRACIGYRFALVEIKALLFTLVRAFQLDLAIPGSNIVKKSAMIQKPVLGADNSNQLPLIVRPIAYN